MRRIHFSPRRSDSAKNPETTTRVCPPEFVAELQSAASMVFSREECVALAKELEEIRNSKHPAAA